MLDRLELDRTLAAFDGHAGGQRRDMEFPDGHSGRPGAGRRRDLDRGHALLPPARHPVQPDGRQIDDIHERGEPIAVLWASDARIYGRSATAAPPGTRTSPSGTARACSVPRLRGPGLRLRITEPQEAAGRTGQGLRHAAAHPAGLLRPERILVNHIAEDPDEGRPGSSPCAACSPTTHGPPGVPPCTRPGRWDEDTFLPDERPRHPRTDRFRPGGDRLAVVQPSQPRPGQRGDPPGNSRQTTRCCP